MLAWERQEGESERAYQGFCVYRDLGPARSLAKVGQMLGKSTALMERWSVAHSWVDRVAALAARDEMLRREAVEEHLRAQADDHAAREVRIAEKLLEVREVAAEQALFIARWPLSEQRIVKEDEDGNATTVVVMPARWTKATAAQLAGLAAGVVAGSGVRKPEDEEGELDLDDITEEEIQTYLDLDEKIHNRARKRPGAPRK